MIIGIDFDQTITEDIKCWIKIIKLFQDFGHKIYIVSARRNTMDNYRYIESNLLRNLDEGEELKDIGIILCYDEPKKNYCHRNNIKISIWIDDKPESIISCL